MLACLVDASTGMVLASRKDQDDIGLPTAAAGVADITNVLFQLTGELPVDGLEDVMVTFRRQLYVIRLVNPEPQILLRLPDLAGSRGERREIPARRRRTPGGGAAAAPGGRSPAGRRHRPAGPADRRAGRHPAADARHADLLGTKLGEELGVPHAAVDVLIGKATSLDLQLPQAIRSDRVEYVRLLLGAGADPGTRTNGITPLENAIGAGSTQMVDLLAEHGIVPAALWTYAACGRLDLVRACFDADGRLRPDAALPRPNPADFFPIPPQNPPTDDPEQIMAEAFVHACQHGRTEVVRWFLDRGLNPDVAAYFGRTGLVWAVMYQKPEVVGLLMERGADPARGDAMVPFGAKALVAILLAADQHDPVVRQLDKLLSSRSRG